MLWLIIILNGDDMKKRITQINRIDTLMILIKKQHQGIYHYKNMRIVVGKIGGSDKNMLNRNLYKYRKENNICYKCGKSNDSKYTRCDQCR